MSTFYRQDLSKQCNSPPLQSAITIIVPDTPGRPWLFSQHRAVLQKQINYHTKVGKYFESAFLCVENKIRACAEYGSRSIKNEGLYYTKSRVSVPSSALVPPTTNYEMAKKVSRKPESRAHLAQAPLSLAAPHGAGLGAPFPT